MNSSYEKIHSKSRLIRKGLTLCVALLLLSQMSLAGQVTASVWKKESPTDQQRLLSVHYEKESLVDVLQELARSVEVGISYETEIVPNKRVSYQAQNRSIFKILSAVLKNTGLEATLSENRKVILIKRKALREQVVVQSTITGTVTDAQTGETMPGVNILVKGTSTGASTDANGQFELEVESLQDTLVVSFVGYQTKQIPIRGRTEINIALQSQAITGEEMVVVGYGSETSRKNLAGSISSVKGEELTDIPASSVDQVLGGRAAGVQITRTSGAPGSGSMIRIRGGNSINGNNDPLFVIDGYVAGESFDLNNIDVNNIKSIDILKGPTAVGIYGTRGSNGVVQIITKKGLGSTPGEPQIDISTYTGIQTKASSVDLVNGLQQAEYANEDAEFRSASLPYPDLTNVPNVDWLDLISRRAPIYQANAAFSGVSPDRTINYYVSGGYFNQQGVIRNSGINKYQFRANVDINLSDNVRTGVRFQASRNHQINNKVDFTDILTRGPIPSRAIYNDDGLYTAFNPVSGSIRDNPEASINLVDDDDYVTNLLGQIYLEVEPLDNLTLRTMIAPEIRYSKTNTYYPSTLPGKRVVGEAGEGGVSVNSYTNIQNQNTINYITDLNSENHLNLLGGFTWTIHQAEGVTARAEGFASDIAKYNNLETGSDPTRNYAGSSWGSYQLVSWFGRSRYTLRDRYIVTLVGRVDGSSRFSSAEKQYGFFPSAAVAWRLSQEPFIKKMDLFSDLKLKASYGISGSQGIGSFRTLSLYNGVNPVFGEQEQSGVILGRPANPELGWEKTKELDIGLNAGFFGDRLSFNAEFYHKKTQDLLLNVQIPRQTGFTSRLQNLGVVQNNGLEFQVTSDNIVSNDIQWSTTLTFSGNRSKVLDLGGQEYINTASPNVFGGNAGPAGRLVIGKSAPVFVGVEYLGTWKSQEEIDDSGQSGQELGGPHFKDTNRDGSIAESDFEVLGSPQPDFYGGINNTVNYKNFRLDIFFQGSYGNEIYNIVTQSAFFPRPEKTKYAEVVNRWTPNNRDSNIPRSGTVGSTVKNNSAEVENGSYLRLKNLKLSYNLPVAKIGLNAFKKMSVYLSGTNLMLLSDFRLFDPETSQYGNSNVNIGFSSGEYPYPRTFTIGIKASL